jgi:16S rRNA processing protein RimM
LSSLEGKALVLGRVSGFRGNHGEITVKVVSGEAARWVHLNRVVIHGSGPGVEDVPRRVESVRAYRDRLVLKLAGVDDANDAAALRGSDVLAPAEDVPRLPQDVYWVERLVGLLVTDAALGPIGRVADVIEAGGRDLLIVKDDQGVETLVPMVREFVIAIDEAAGTIRVALPEGLRGLDADGGPETA